MTLYLLALQSITKALKQQSYYQRKTEQGVGTKSNMLLAKNKKREDLLKHMSLTRGSGNGDGMDKNK